MNIKSYLSVLATVVLFISCGGDDNTPEAIPFRDRGEQSIEDDTFIREYLQTHFYNYEDFANPPTDFDFEIRFDTIAGDNADKTPMLDQITTKTYERFDTSNTLYILTAREGVGTPATFVDSTLVTYRGDNILSNTFDAANNPIWFDLSGTIDGFTNGLAGFKGGSGLSTDENGDIILENGVPVFENDYGIGAIFIPSGLGYFAQPPSTDIGIYSSLVFTFSLYDIVVTDHDDDGILSIDEDVDSNGFLFDEIDNTDGDVLANFIDPDDDNDGVRTRLEIVFATTTIINDEGEPEEVEVFDSFLDTDNDGVNDYLDDDDDGDGIDTIDEINLNLTTGAITFPDSDGDGTPDYLDSDS